MSNVDYTPEDRVLSMEAPIESKGAGTQHSAVTFEHIEDEREPHVHSKTILVVAAVSLISFAQLVQLVATGALSSYVALAVGNVSQSSWMLSSLTIAFVVLAPPVSQAADYWGRRWLLIILTMIGCVGVLVTSRATSMGMAIAGEVLVGVSFAATPLQFAVASEVLPRKHRLSGQAAVNAAGGIGSLFALLSGGKFVEVYGPQGYRYLYYVNAGMFAIAALFCYLFYKPPVLELQKSMTTSEKLRSLDWLGYTITMFGVVLFSVGLSWSNNPYSWSDAHVLAPFILGLAAFAVLALYSGKVKRDSYIPHKLFSRDRNFALSLGGIFCEGLVFAAANIYVPTQTIVLFATTSMQVSLVFTVALCCYVVGSPICAYICYRHKLIRSLVVAGFAAFLVWAICMATIGLGGQGGIYGYQALLGAALALVLNAVVASAQLSAPPELISIASGLVAAIRSLGVTLGIAIYAAIFHARLTSRLPSMVGKAAIDNGLPTNSLPALLQALASGQADLLSEVPDISPVIIAAASSALKNAYLGSFQSVWIAAACISAAGLICSACLVDRTVDLNNHIDNPVEAERELYGEK